MTMDSAKRDPRAAVARNDPEHARETFDNVVAMFWHAVDVAGGRPALIDQDRSISYAEYGRAVAALADVLTRINVAGERVIVLVPNSIEANLAILGSLVAGAQVTMLNPAYTLAEIEPLIEAADPKAMILLAGSESHGPAAAAAAGIEHVLRIGEGELSLPNLIESDKPRPGIQIKPNDLASLMFTGGTTGKPKGVDRTHRSLVDAIAGMDEAWPTRLDDEVWLNVAPVSHIWGFLMGCFNPIYSRSTLVIVRRFSPDLVIEAIERHKVTVFSGGPAAIYVGLLSAERLASADLSSLRVCPGGGSPFLLETLTAWEKRVGVPILEASGMTEAGPITANPTDGGHRFGTVGRPLSGIELQIVDVENPEQVLPTGAVGEIRIRGPRVVSRYRGVADCHPDGWLYTGDVGVIDEDGFVRLVDRKKDMLIVSGFNVYPREVEEVLAKHPAVAEAAVIGICDERKGEVPVAFVSPRSGASTNPAELAEFCAARLVGYKHPKWVALLDSIPKTPANKIDRQGLAKIAAEHDEQKELQ